MRLLCVLLALAAIARADESVPRAPEATKAQVRVRGLDVREAARLIASATHVNVLVAGMSFGGLSLDLENPDGKAALGDLARRGWRSARRAGCS